MVVEPRPAPAAATSAALSEGWRTVRFGEVVRNANKQEPDPLEAGIERYVGLEHLDPGSLHIRKWGLVEEGTTFTRKFSRGQVLFPKRRVYQRKVGVAEFDGVCSGDILVFEAKREELLPELLPFIVESEAFFEHALQTSAGSLSPRTRWRDLARQEFPLPPKDEQRRIAEILWAADEACLTKERLIDAAFVVRRAALDRLILGAACANEAAPVVPLRHICDMQNGRIFPSHNYCEDGIRLLRPGNLAADGHVSWREDVTQSLPEEYKESAKEYLVRPGDVVINLTAQSLEDAFMGRVCIARPGDDSLLNQRIGRFLCRDDIMPEFLFRCLQTTHFRRLVEAKCEGSKIRHLYWRHISDFPVQLPSQDVQEAIVRRASKLDEAVARAEEALAVTRRLCGTLRQVLLSSGTDGAL